MSLCTSLMASGARASRALVRSPRVGRGARARPERLGGLPCRIGTRPAPGAVRALHAKDGGEGYVGLVVCLSMLLCRVRSADRTPPPAAPLSRAPHG